MLFRKEHPRCCGCCLHSKPLNNEEVLCAKKGNVSVDSRCLRFIYDPCKRVPVKPKAPDFSKYDSDDFSL